MVEIDLYKRDFLSFNDSEFEETVITGLNLDHICDLEKNDHNFSCKRFYIKTRIETYASHGYKDILHKCKRRNLIFKDISREIEPMKISSLRAKLRNEITKNKRESKKHWKE